MPVTVRHAVLNDVEGILAIVNYAILHTTAVYDYAPRLLTDMQEWFYEKEQAGHPVIVAETDNVIYGYGTYGQLKAKEGYKYCVEHSVYVAQGHQDKGIGRLLLSQLIQIAKAQGMHSMVGIIDADNDSSIAFHEKFGFTKTGILKQAGYKFDKWLDVQFMQLMLH